MTLGQAQRAFTLCVSKLIRFAYEQGYELTFGDAYRDPRKYGEFGERLEGCYSSARSNHKRRLAVDLNLFRDGQYLTSTEDHKALGEFWEALGEHKGLNLRWGGRWNDGNHYELHHE